MSECKTTIYDDNGNELVTVIDDHKPKHDKFCTTWTKNWSKDKDRKEHHYDMPENVRRAFKL